MAVVCGVMVAGCGPSRPAIAPYLCGDPMRVWVPSHGPCGVLTTATPRPRATTRDEFDAGDDLVVPEVDAPAETSILAGPDGRLLPRRRIGFRPE